MTRKEWLDQELSVYYVLDLEHFVETAESMKQELTVEFIEDEFTCRFEDDFAIVAMRGGNYLERSDKIIEGDQVWSVL